MRLGIFSGLLLLGPLVGPVSLASAQRPPTLGERITASANAKSAFRKAVQAEIKIHAQKEADKRRWGSQSFYRGPKGDVINSHDLPPGGQLRGYHFLGTRDNGTPQPWQRRGR